MYGVVLLHRFHNVSENPMGLSRIASESPNSTDDIISSENNVRREIKRNIYIDI